MSSPGDATGSTTCNDGGGGTGYPYTSGGSFVPLLPFMEQSTVYNAINFNYNIFGAGNTTVTATSLSYLHCPSDPAIETKVFMAGRQCRRRKYDDVLFQLWR